MTYFPTRTAQRQTLDCLGRLLAAHLAAAPAWSVRRALLIPAVVVVMALVVLQEGYQTLLTVVHDVEKVLPALTELGVRVPPPILSLLALVLMGWMIVMVPIVWTRALRRLTALGMDA